MHSSREPQIPALPALIIILIMIPILIAILAVIAQQSMLKTVVAKAMSTIQIKIQ